MLSFTKCVYYVIRMEFKTFSCYDNFVPGNNCGAPEHTPTHYALQHLERLLQATSQRVRMCTPEQLAAGRSPPVPTPPPIVLAGQSQSTDEKSESENNGTIDTAEPSTSKRKSFVIFWYNTKVCVCPVR